MNSPLVSPICILISVILLSSCTSDIQVDGFSSEVWKSDRNGCNNERVIYADVIMDSKAEILGKSEQAVLKLMGRPDKNELYRRQQKFYIYFLEPGPMCNNTIEESESASYLRIRFNATGVVNELFIYNN